MGEVPRVAVLFDCDNVPATAVEPVLTELAAHGTMSIKRAYGDFSGPQLKAWAPVCRELAIHPVQQYPNRPGKNATDSALIIDAMDLLYQTETDIFCIISSDSDFTRLASRLRESGKHVHGVGARVAPAAFQNACDRFTHLELLLNGTGDEIAGNAVEERANPESRTRTETGAPAQTPDGGAETPVVAKLLHRAIKASIKEDGWAPLSAVGSYLISSHPSFDTRTYGHAKLSDLVQAQPGIKVRKRTSSGGTAVLWVRQT